jgi:hypothetical protein
MDVKNTTHEDLAQIVGFSATIRLTAYFGGRNLFVPKSVSEETVLAKVIGESAAKLLAQEYGGDVVWVPTLHLAEVDLRNARVLEQLRKGVSTDVVAANAGLSVRRVQQLRLQFEAHELLPKILGKNTEENSAENLGENHE